jgi:hypothetical protein
VSLNYLIHGITTTMALRSWGRPWVYYFFFEGDAITGVIGFTSLWYLSLRKEAQGVDIWSGRGLRISLGLSFFCCAAQIAFIFPGCK